MEQSETVAENKRRVQRLLEGMWNQRNPAIIDELAAEGITVTNVSEGEDVHGTAKLKKMQQMTLEGIPDLEVTVNRLLAEDDAVVAHWTIHGTHEGILAGIAPTGETVEWDIVSLFTFDGSQITEYWALSNSLGLLRQMNAIPETPFG